MEAWNTGGAQRLRQDELWRHTCCEAFIKRSKGYHELNFAPNGDWAAYTFADYRDGRSLPNIATPVADAHRRGDSWQLQAFVDLSALPDLNDSEPWTLGVSAVMERKDGGISYWALAHPPGKPDFHHPDSFTLTLPPLEPA